MEELSYNFELEKAVEKIKREKAKLVCIQMPEGLKARALEIADYLEEKKSKFNKVSDREEGTMDMPIINF